MWGPYTNVFDVNVPKLVMNLKLHMYAVILILSDLRYDVLSCCTKWTFKRRIMP